MIKYRVSHLPNTSHALNFIVKSAESQKASTFSFARPLIHVWGNPLESKLKTLMVAYIKKHGWGKEPVAMSLANSPRNLSHFISSLPKK